MATLGHHHDAIVLAVIVVVLQQRADMVDVDLLLGNQNHMRSARDAGSISNPPRVAAHHLDNDYATVRVGGCVNAIYRLGGDRYCRVISECGVGAANVVVDRLWHTYARDAVLAQKERNRLRIVTAQGDERVNLVDRSEEHTSEL